MRLEFQVTIAFIVILVSIVLILTMLGSLRSRKNPKVELCIERYVVSHKYALPSTSPFIMVAYYSRIGNKILISISAVAMIAWRRILRKYSIKDYVDLNEELIREFMREINVVLIHEFTEWGVHQLNLRRLFTHQLWNDYIRENILAK
ncbi:MAG: hypothetical protein QXE67_02935 [Nitrososphaerota archaeon]|nr:hypothetical protein [Candidatus Geocrenenecus dongiae]